LNKTYIFSLFVAGVYTIYLGAGECVVASEFIKKYYLSIDIEEFRYSLPKV